MKPAELARKRILVTNDDGINAPGLEAMIDIATQLSSDVWVVAPEFNQSGAGHSLSLSHPVRARQVSETKFALEGTPTDCVLFAVKHLLKDRKPDIVLSGVNRGGNMSDDVTYSGTIAGAMEGCLLGIPSIAFSQPYTQPHPPKWGTADPVRRRRGAARAGHGHPAQRADQRQLPRRGADGRSRACASRARACAASAATSSSAPTRAAAPTTGSPTRPGEHEHDEESDLTAVRSGYVSVTPLHLDLTHEATRRKLAAQFDADSEAD